MLYVEILELARMSRDVLLESDKQKNHCKREITRVSINEITSVSINEITRFRINKIICFSINEISCISINSL